MQLTRCQPSPSQENLQDLLFCLGSASRFPYLILLSSVGMLLTIPTVCICKDYRDAGAWASGVYPFTAKCLDQMT